MGRYSYPATIQPDGDGFMVEFDGLAGVTFGGTREEALREAADLLVSALNIFVRNGQATPAPEEANGRLIVTVTILEAAKLVLHDAMIASGVGVNELARRLGIDEKAVRRLRDPLHGSKIEAVEAALRELGTVATVDFATAA